jgi:hypothetical protein
MISGCSVAGTVSAGMVMAFAGMTAPAASKRPKPAAVIDLAIVNICDSFEIRRRCEVNLHANLAAEHAVIMSI